VSATNDHPIPADVRRWDEFRELAAAIADEAMPRAVVLPAEFTRHHARLLVLFILGDREMRRLMTELLLRTERPAGTNPDEGDNR